MISTYLAPNFLHYKVSSTHFMLCCFYCLIIHTSCSTTKDDSDQIDRYQLVNRHNVLVSRIDSLSPLSVGNGEFTYTADITGMQTFPEVYERGISLGTQSQWGWHTTPSDSGYTHDDVAVFFESCNDRSVPYAVQHHEGRAARAANWLRANPHRIHLGMVGLSIQKSNGQEVLKEDVGNPMQELNLWTGKLESNFEIEGVPVTVETVCHQQQDQLSFRITSPLLTENRIKIRVRFPFADDCGFCPGYAWEQDDRHTSELIEQGQQYAHIKRTLDTTNYFVGMHWGQSADLVKPDAHTYLIDPGNRQDTFEYTIYFSATNSGSATSGFQGTMESSRQGWEHFWNSGGAIDFSSCTDPRAPELERRVVLSQYLMKIQCAGSMPPQETGLTFNSWHGKFHMEMHWWHAAHNAYWGRPELLERSLGWYFDNLENARNTAQWQGYEGVRWQKMTSPYGQSSPSNVGEFLVWQQPHIIYFAELLYGDDPSETVLNKYKDLVFETAEFMASFAQFNKTDGKYHLCPPLIPAQEHFKATETSDPAFELSYWHWGLRTALKWRERLGMEPDQRWREVLNNLAPIPENDQFYLPTAEATDAFSNFEKRRDHPIVVGAYGFLPNDRIDVMKLAATFDEVMREWNWQRTWGWDYPLLALSATRLNKPEDAINALFTNAQKNTFLINGHNYQDGRLTIYLPGNGGLLAAVAMMAAGFEGASLESPGFPKDGTWNIKWEGLKPML